MRAVPLIAGEPHACDYLSGQRARLAYVAPLSILEPMLYSRLVAAGFRRSGELVYRPHCPDCRACIPTRVPVARFAPDRSQRRNWRLNGDLTARVGHPEVRDDHFELFIRYQQGRHGDGSMARMTREDYAEFVAAAWCDSFLVEFRRDDALLGVAVVDQLEDGFSSVYTYFEPAAEKRGLGTYAVLWQIAEARRRSLRHVYLGFWIGACHKMAYKIRFKPLEVLVGSTWRPVDGIDPAAVADQT